MGCGALAIGGVETIEKALMAQPPAVLLEGEASYFASESRIRGLTLDVFT